MEKSPSWSRAHDWKSCNREKRFESSNLSFSAKKTRRFSRVFCRQKRDSRAINYRGPRGILCTRGEKEHTSKRVSIIAPDNAISEAKCATCTRQRRRTLRCTLHYASKLARSRCKANLSFSKTRGAEEMFVAKQQLTSLSPRREILCNQYTGVLARYCVLAGRRSTRAKE